jgi:hypothetical protein
MNYTPKADKAEWHLTYRCDLACVGCNRACFLPGPPATPDMTLADAQEFSDQARALGWFPRIILIGGEPTLHPDLFGFLDLAAGFSAGAELWSNGYRPEAKEILERVRRENRVKVIEGTIKTRSVVQPVRDIFLAPCDFHAQREPCGTHSLYADPDCGISVDAGGYTVCCMGGMIDGILDLGARTKRLADLFDPSFADAQTRMLCNHCGQHLGIDNERFAGSAERFGIRVSPTWQDAFDRLAAGRSGP